MKTALTIAGSDCSGGAGIQADLKTFSANGVFGMSVIVSVVAENTSRVISVEDISPEMIKNQIDAVFEDIEVDAVKVGMLSSEICMKAVAEKLRQYKPKYTVIDPVMVAKGGHALMKPEALEALKTEVIPLAYVLTPNIPEAEVLPMGINYLQILGISQLFMCMEIATQGAFGGLGKTIPPSVVSITFTTARIPLAAVLSMTALGLSGIWWSISISSIIKGIVLVAWFVYFLRKYEKK